MTKEDNKSTKKQMVKSTKDKVSKTLDKKVKKLEDKFNKKVGRPAKDLTKKVADKVERAKRNARAKQQKDEKVFKEVKNSKAKVEKISEKQDAAISPEEQFKQLQDNIESTRKFEEEKRLSLQAEENARSAERHRLDEEEHNRLKQQTPDPLKPLSEMVVDKPAPGQLKYAPGDKVKVTDGMYKEYPGIKDQEGSINRITENNEYEVQFNLGGGVFIIQNFEEEEISK